MSIGIPVLNEEKHIERVVRGFLGMDYPRLVEVLIADGGSIDKTREIIEKITEEDPRVKLIDNPDKYQSHGLNKMIGCARGDIFLRADGHCLYQDDYIEKNIKTLLETGSRNVGGSQRYVAETPVQAGTAIAVQSFLGNGGAKYMNENFEGFADTVFLGCFWTEDLKELDGFNTENVTNQDSELNLRLHDYFGKSIFVSPDIKSWYYPRDNYARLFIQYFRYGRGRLLTKILHPKSSPIRGLIPFIFIGLVIIYGLLDLFMTENLYFPVFMSLLLAVFIIESVRVVFSSNSKFRNAIWQSNSEPPGLFSRWVHVIVSVVIMQVAHFSGFAYQLFKRVFLGKKGW